MAGHVEASAVVRETIASLWPGRFDVARLDAGTSLGKDGLGLDSIDIVEVVLECHVRAGRPTYDADGVLGDGPVTIGRLVDHLSAL